MFARNSEHCAQPLITEVDGARTQRELSDPNTETLVKDRELVEANAILTPMRAIRMELEAANKSDMRVHGDPGDPAHRVSRD